MINNPSDSATESCKESLTTWRNQSVDTKHGLNPNSTKQCVVLLNINKELEPLRSSLFCFNQNTISHQFVKAMPLSTININLNLCIVSMGHHKTAVTPLRSQAIDLLLLERQRSISMPFYSTIEIVPDFFSIITICMNLKQHFNYFVE